MIEFVTGNIFETDAEAIVNTVNTVGVMGKGLALQFRELFPQNYITYKKACQNGKLEIGRLLIVRDSSIVSGEKIIINFPTKKHWREPSKYEYIISGLHELKSYILKTKIHSIAIPPLGAGNGKLDWHKVKQLIAEELKELDCTIKVYEPISEQTILTPLPVKDKKVTLTVARALLLSIFYEVVREGEFVSEFTAEKVAYFLQKFGAQSEFNLTFKEYYYGPYSGKVRFVLSYLNNHYVGFSDLKGRKPFEPINVFVEKENDVKDFLKLYPKSTEILEKTKEFLSGFYGDYSLELLATVDYIVNIHNAKTLEDVKNHIAHWSVRKSTTFKNDEHLLIALNHILGKD